MSLEPATTHEPWTVGRLLAWTTEHLRNHGVEEPRLAGEILLAHALNCRRIELYTRFNDDPGDQVRTAFRDLVRPAAAHTPIAYLVGHKEFYSLDFEVTPDVLIPRPETEALVERAIDTCRAMEGDPDRKGDAIHVLDMGTGSGCIIVAALHHAPRACGVATDISPTALEIARRNALRHGLDDRIRFVEADRLALPVDALPEGGFDLIVSNPPYVAKADLETLPPNVRQHEPMIALTAGDDGLEFFRTLATDGPRLLRPDGAILVEIGAGQGDAVGQVFTAADRFRHVGTYRNRSDPHDRVMQFAVL